MSLEKNTVGIIITGCKHFYSFVAAILTLAMQSLVLVQ